MSKILITLILLLLANSRVNAQNVQASAQEKSESSESQSDEQQEIEIDELIKALENQINAKNADGKESQAVNEYWQSDGGASENKPAQSEAAEYLEQASLRPVNSNPRDRTFLNGRGAESSRDASVDAPAAQAGSGTRMRLDKRKIFQNNRNVDELNGEAFLQRTETGFRHQPLTEYEKDEQYYRALLRLQNLYRLYNRRFQNSERINEQRRSRHCGDHYYNKQMDLINTRKLHYLEKSQRIADRIAQSAMHLARKKSHMYDKLLSPICSGCHNYVETGPVLEIIHDEATKRDVEVASASSAGASVDTSVNAGGASIDTSVGASSASAASVSTGAGGSSSSISTASDVSSSLSVGTGYGGGISTGSRLSTSTDSRLSLGVGKGTSLLGQLSSCEDYERKMIMDMAIEEAAGLIRKLAFETRSEAAYRADPDFDRRVLSLAIELVNKVTAGATGGMSKFDLLAGLRYNSVDDYLKATAQDLDFDGELVSNAGFDYVNYGMGKNRGPYDNLDLYDEYVGHASPYSRGEVCPLCKRSGHTFTGRTKRNVQGTGRDGILYHLEQVTPRKVNIA